MKIVIYSLLVLCFVTIGCSDLFDRSKNKLPIDIELINTPGDILFTVPENGSRSLYSMDANGANVKKIFETNERIMNAKWNNIGNKILISIINNRSMSNRYSSDVYILNVDTGKIEFIDDLFVDTQTSQSGPRWHHSDRGILFLLETAPAGLNSDVFMYDLDSKSVTNLSNTNNISELHFDMLGDTLYTAQRSSVVKYNPNGSIEYLENGENYFYSHVLNAEGDVFYTKPIETISICDKDIKEIIITNVSNSIQFGIGDVFGFGIISKKNNLFLIERIHFIDENSCVINVSNRTTSIILYNITSDSYIDITPEQFKNLTESTGRFSLHSWR